MSQIFNQNPLLFIIYDRVKQRKVTTTFASLMKAQVSKFVKLVKLKQNQLDHKKLFFIKILFNTTELTM